MPSPMPPCSDPSCHSCLWRREDPVFGRQVGAAYERQVLDPCARYLCEVVSGLSAVGIPLPPVDIAEDLLLSLIAKTITWG